MTRGLTRDDEGTIRDALKHKRWAELARALGWQDQPPLTLSLEQRALWGLDQPEQGSPDPDQTTALYRCYATRGELRLLVASGVDDLAQRRQLVLRAHRFNPTRAIVWWFAPGAQAPPAQAELTCMIADHGQAGQPVVRSLTLSLEQPGQLELRRLMALGCDHMVEDPLGDQARALRAQWRQVLSQGELTTLFYRRFMGLHVRLSRAMTGGPSDQAARRLIAMTILLRLIVLCFLERAGALDGDPRYLMRLRQRTQLQGLDFYQDALNPLCFGALSCPQGQREAALASLGRLPFLNGGLFEPSALERAHPQMTWPEAVWVEIVDEFLQEHRFTLFELSEQDAPWAISPEVLGRVFESLMWPERRKATGAFYSPPQLVRQLVRRGLMAHLERHAQLDSARAQAALDGRADALSPEDAARAKRALRELRALDPAVGTGAFLVELLHQLVGALDGLGEGPAPGQTRWSWLASLIHHHLHGVDVDTTAVRLCEVRLWLVLLADQASVLRDPAQVQPLPNLSHRVVEGDSLLSMWSLLKLRGPQARAWQLPDSFVRDSSALEVAQRDYLDAHGPQKPQARQALERLERQLALSLVGHQLELNRRRLAPLLALSGSMDLLGQPQQLGASQRQALAQLERERQGLEALRHALQSERQGSLSFAYSLRFAQVMAQGGFDLIVTNPPWVRATQQAPHAKALYMSRYACAHSALWPDAQAQGIATTFGAQVDLSAIFLERSLELLRPEGALAALCPAKLLRSLQGGAIRRALMAQELLYIEDRSEIEREDFDAVTYPAALVLRKRPSAPVTLVASSPDSPDRSQAWQAGLTRVEVALWSGGAQPQRWVMPQRELPLGDDPAYPWLLDPPEPGQALRALWQRHKPMGIFPRLRPRRGVMTGKNEAFVMTPWQARALLGEQADRWFRPVVAGADIDQERLRAHQVILWPYDAKLNLKAALPLALREHLESWRAPLEQRSDHVANRPLWQLFRVQEGVQQPKVIWADMGRSLRVGLAHAEVVPLNTTYYIPFMDEVRAWVMQQVLMSPQARRFCALCAERARGGFRRHLAWVISLLPIPALLGSWLNHGPGHAYSPASLLEEDGEDWRYHMLDGMWAECFAAQDTLTAQAILARMYHEGEEWLPPSPKPGLEPLWREVSR